MKRSCFLFLLMAVFAFVVHSQEFPVVGARALGMGGAYVAFADDATSAYWNPAAIPTRRIIDINVIFDGKTSQTYNLLTPMQDIYNLNLQDNPLEAEEFGNILGKINTGNPFLYGGIQYGIFYTNDIFSAGYFESSVITARTTIDLDRLDPNAASNDFVLKNESALNYRRVKFSEYIFGGGYLLWSEDSFIGLTVKYVTTSTSVLDRKLVSDIEKNYDEIDFAFEDFSEDAHSDAFITFDAGLLFYIAQPVRVGVVGRNILSPSFEITETEKLTMNAQWRAGTAIQIAESVVVTADFDITKNRYFGEEPSFKQAAIGFEAGLFNKTIYLRGGLNKNVANSDTPLVFCGGLGVVFQSVIIDAAMQYSPERENLIAGVQLHIFYKE